MATKVARTGVTREKGWLYFLDKKGDVSRTPMLRGTEKAVKGRRQRVAQAGVERENGWLYFIDKDGDVARVKMARPGSRRRSAAKPKTKAKPKRAPDGKWAMSMCSVRTRSLRVTMPWPSSND